MNLPIKSLFLGFGALVAGKSGALLALLGLVLVAGLLVRLRFHHRERSRFKVARAGRGIPIETSAAPVAGAADGAGVVQGAREVPGNRQADEALRQNEARYRSLIELSPNAIWIDRDDRIEMPNPQALQLLGATREQMLGRSSFQAFHPDSRDRMRERLDQVRRGQMIQLSEETIARMDGTTRQVEFSAAAFQDSEGPAVQVVLHDITERKLRNEQLQKLNRALRAVSSSSQALMRSETVAESVYLREICDIITRDCGHAMVWIGFKEDDPDRTITPVAHAGFEAGYLETLHLTWADDERGRGATGMAIRTGRPSMCRDTGTDPAFGPWRAEAEKRGYRSSLALPLLTGGKAFGAVTCYSLEADAFSPGETALLEELTSDLARGITTNRLRTAHAMAEETLRESEERFRTAFDNGAIPMALTTLEGALLRVNSALCAMFGCSESDLKDQTFWSITHPDDLARTRAGMAAISRGETTRLRMEKRYLRKDGTVLWGDMTTASVPDAMGRPLYLVTHIQDVTDRKRVQAELLAANQRKDEFLATLAHELRNPLATIRNSAFILDLHPTQDPEVRQACGLIAHHSAHMARLVDDLLDVSRIERGKIGLRKERVDLSQVMGHALEACKPLIQARRHQLTLAMPDPAPVLQADPARLEQMLCNLVNNACKYTPDGGIIRLSATREDAQLVVRIRDNGLGMTPELMNHAFDLFFQAAQPMDRPPGGLGLGLTLVRQLAELHGGSVTAASEGPGRGSEFTLRLPAPEPPSGPAPEPSALPEAGTGHRQVLVVDDDPNVRATTAMLLKAMGFQVSTAATGEQGIERAQTLRPDIALIDLGMPGLNGLEVASRIRAALGSGIYLVALTGFSRESDVAGALAAGFDQHVVKSGDPRELLQVLRAIGAELDGASTDFS